METGYPLGPYRQVYHPNDPHRRRVQFVFHSMYAYFNSFNNQRG